MKNTFNNKTTMAKVGLMKNFTNQVMSKNNTSFNRGVCEVVASIMESIAKAESEEPQ